MTTLPDDDQVLTSGLPSGLSKLKITVSSANPNTMTTIIAALIARVVSAFTTRRFNDGASWIHIAAGHRMLELSAVLHTDPFFISSRANRGRRTNGCRNFLWPWRFAPADGWAFRCCSVSPPPPALGC